MLKNRKTLYLFPALVSLFFGIAPIFYGVLNAGGIALITFGAILLVLYAIIDKPKFRVLYRFISITAIFCFAAGAVVSLLMLGAMLSASMPKDSTVVVLGAGIRDDRPLSMLRSRLDTAVGFLESNPDARVVVTGGQAPDEDFSEAEVMKNYLIDKGIASNRIICEDKADNTQENMKFTAVKLIENNIQSKNVITVTDGFHQLRTKIYSSRAGLAAYPLSSPTPWLFLPSSWVREFFALVKAVVL